MASLGLTQTVVAVCIWPDLEQGTETAVILLCGEASTIPALSCGLACVFEVGTSIFDIINYVFYFEL